MDRFYMSSACVIVFIRNPATCWLTGEQVTIKTRCTIALANIIRAILRLQLFITQLTRRLQLGSCNMCSY